MTYSNVVDLSVDELRILIREIVTQTIFEVLGDLDAGLELQDEVRDRLSASLKSAKVGKNTISAQKVAENLGLEW